MASLGKAGLDFISEAGEPGGLKQIEVGIQPERHARTFTKPSQASEDGNRSIDHDLDDVLYTSSSLNGALAGRSCFDGGPPSALPYRRREAQHSHTEQGPMRNELLPCGSSKQLPPPQPSYIQSYGQQSLARPLPRRLDNHLQ